MWARRWFVWCVCAVLLGCGVSSASNSEHIEERQAQLALPPQISAAFPVDQAVPDLDPNATLLNVTGSAAGGYLLSYCVVHRPWSRVQYGTTATPAEFVFLHWDPTGGAPNVLARFPSRAFSGQDLMLKAVEVDDGWLIAYGEAVDDSRHTRLLKRDGNLGAATDLPSSSCGYSYAATSGFARGGSTALLADFCGTGLLLDLTGNVLASLTITTRDAFVSPSIGGRVGGGQVAFNGIDYLVTYGFQPNGGPMSLAIKALAFPITTAGAIAQPLVLATPRAQPVPLIVGVAPIGLVANGSAFLTLLYQPNGFSSDVSYRILTEAPDHTFTFGNERYLSAPLGTQARQATALALNGHFAIACLPNTGAMELILPSSNPALPDISQPLPGDMGVDIHEVPLGVSTDGSRLLIASNRRAARYDDTLHLIDQTPATLLWALHGQLMPSFAFAGSRYLATWTENIPDGLGYYGGDGTQIRANHLSNTGEILDTASLVLSQTGADSRMIANSSWFASVWRGGGVMLTTSDPPVLTPFAAPTTISHVWSIGTDGEHLVTAYDNHYDVVFLQMLSDGTFFDGVTVATGIADATVTPPAIAFNAGKYAVLWTVAGDPGERVIYGARISAEQELLDDPPIELLRFSSPDIPGRSGQPADPGLELIPSGDHFLLAWADVAANVEELRIARLSDALTLLDPGGVLVATQPYPLRAFYPRRMALGWDGSNDWVVWMDGEGGARSPLASVRGRRYFANLTPTDADPFLISSDVDEESRVTLAVGDGGQSLVGYTRYLASDFSYRVQARFLSSTPFADGVPCSSSGQCENGACVASVCSPVVGAGGSMAGGSGGGTVDGGVVAGNGGAGGSGAAGGTSSGDGSTGGIVTAGAGTGGNLSGGTEGVGGNAGANGTAGTDATSGGIGGLDGGGGSVTGGSVAAGGSSSNQGGTAGSADVSDAGSVAVGGDGGSDSIGGNTAGGSEVDAGGGARPTGTGGASGARAGHSGTSGSMADGSGGPRHHSCSVRLVGVRAPNSSFVSLAGLVAALCWFSRRRKARVTAHATQIS